MSISDKVAKKKNDWDQKQAMMKESLLVRSDDKESAHIFDVEIKKMPEDSHNKVFILPKHSCTSRGNLTSASPSRWVTDHTTSGTSMRVCATRR